MVEKESQNHFFKKTVVIWNKRRKQRKICDNPLFLTEASMKAFAKAMVWIVTASIFASQPATASSLVFPHRSLEKGLLRGYATHEGKKKSHRGLIVGGVAVAGAWWLLHKKSADGQSVAENQSAPETSEPASAATPEKAPRKKRKGAGQSRKLAKNMEATDGERPDGCAAHHIVPYSEERAFAKDLAKDSREILKECKIDLNSPENGVYLPAPTKKHPVAKCEGSDHASLHTELYYIRLLAELGSAKVVSRLLKGGDGCAGVVDKLAEIKNDLKTGKLTGLTGQ